MGCTTAPPHPLPAFVDVADLHAPNHSSTTEYAQFRRLWDDSGGLTRIGNRYQHVPPNLTNNADVTIEAIATLCEPQKHRRPVGRWSQPSPLPPPPPLSGNSTSSSVLSPPPPLMREPSARSKPTSGYCVGNESTLLGRGLRNGRGGHRADKSSRRSSSATVLLSNDSQAAGDNDGDGDGDGDVRVEGFAPPISDASHTSGRRCRCWDQAMRSEWSSPADKILAATAPPALTATVSSGRSSRAANHDEGNHDSKDLRHAQQHASTHTPNLATGHTITSRQLSEDQRGQSQRRSGRALRAAGQTEGFAPGASGMKAPAWEGGRDGKGAPPAAMPPAGGNRGGGEAEGVVRWGRVDLLSVLYPPPTQITGEARGRQTNRQAEREEERDQGCGNILVEIPTSLKTHDGRGEGGPVSSILLCLPRRSARTSFLFLLASTLEQL